MGPKPGIWSSHSVSNSIIILQAFGPKDLASDWLRIGPPLAQDSLRAAGTPPPPRPNSLLLGSSRLSIETIGCLTPRVISACGEARLPVTGEVLHRKQWLSRFRRPGCGWACGALGPCKPEASAPNGQTPALARSGRQVGPSERESKLKRSDTSARTKEQLAALKKHHEEEITHHVKEIERLQKEIERHKKKIKHLKDDDD